MKKMTRFTALCMAVIMALACTACSSGGNSSAAATQADTEAAGASPEANESAAPADTSDAEYTIIFGNSGNLEACTSQLVLRFQELIEEKSEGKIKVDFHYGGTLGTDTEMAQGVIAGDYQMMICSTNGYSSVIPKAAVLDMPGLFTDMESAQAAMKEGTVLRTAFDEAMEESGVYCSLLSPNAFRVLSSSKPARTIDELSNLNIRVTDSKYMITYMNALGPKATPLAWSETAVALQQGLVDGQYNPVDSIIRNSFYETQDYVINVNMTMYSIAILTSKAWMDALPAEYQNMIQECMAQVEDEALGIINAVNSEYEAQVADTGMEVINFTDEEYATLKQRTLEATYNLYCEDFGQEYVDTILEGVGVSIDDIRGN